MLNKSILMGRLVKDPTLRYTASNIPVCSFAIAVNRAYKKDEVDFLPIVTWRNTAEFVSKYFKKGMQVVVSGRIQTRTWDDSEGKRHYATEIVADETYFSDSKKDRNSNNSSDYKGTEEEGFLPIESDSDLPF